MNRVAALLLAASLVAACESLGGPERLVADLQLHGLSAAVGSGFQGGPLGGEGTSVCVGAESVSIYTFPDPTAAQAAAAEVDRDDPSHIGNAVVEWVGAPRFWLRDSAMILYVGDDVALDEALREILGPPFAQAVGVGGRQPLNRPPCS